MHSFTSQSLHEALQNSFPSPNFVYLKEVRDATGFDSVRSADALAIGLYRSCGRLIHGFELKVSRSDWLRELKNAAKAESLMRYCHRWALIVPDVSIVHDGELPPTWGLGVVHQTRKNANPKIRWVVKPPELNPEPASMVFLTALIYAARKIDSKEQEALLNKARDEGRKQGTNEHRHKLDNLTRLSDAVEEFEKKSGVRISQYDSSLTAGNKGLSFKKWQESHTSLEKFRNSLQQLKEQADRIAAGIARSLQSLEAEPNDPRTTPLPLPQMAGEIAPT